jgi:hypothetical protein
MSSVYKFIGQEIAITSANTVSLSKVLRITNTTNAITVLQLTNGSANTANTTLVPYETLIVEKNTTDTVAGAGLRAAPIAYRN